MPIDLNNNGKDDIREIEDGFAQLFADAKAGKITAVVDDIQTGVNWTVTEITNMVEDAQTFLTAVKAKVAGEATSVDNAVERALNLINSPAARQAAGLAEEAINDLKGLPSEALATAIGIVKSAQAAL